MRIAGKMKVLYFVLAISLALSVFAGSPSQAQRSLVLTLYNSGVKAYDKGNYREALRIFKQCEASAASTPHSHREEAQLLYSLAETQRCMGQYKDAEQTFKKSLAAVDSLPVKQRDYAFLFNGMALLYQAQGRFAEAEALWKQSESMIGKNNPSLLYPVNNLAQHYFIWGKLQEESDYVDKAGRIAKRAPKTLALPYWELNVAQLAEQRGQYQNAEKQYKTALSNCAKLVGESHPYCGKILTAFAELYRKQSRYADAERCLNQTLKIYQAQYSSEHPDIAETMVRLGRVLSEQGRYSQAREMVKNALKTEESAFGSGDNLFIARAKNCLGNIYRQDGKYQEAQLLIEEALAAERRILGSDSLEIAVTMRDLAMVMEDQGNYSEATSLLQSSLSLIESTTGPDHPERAAGANALAHTYLRDGKYAEAEPLFKKALELSERILGADNVVTAGGAHDLGELYLKQKHFAEAQTYLEKALSTDEKLYGANAPQVAADLTSLAIAFSEQGQPEKAEPLLKRVAEIKNVLPGGNVAIEAPVSVKGSTTDRPVTDKWALVIGISNFKDPSINLKFAAKDATDFKNFLVNTEHFRADHVKLLTDESASRENIIGLLGEKWLATHVKPDDLVVVYVSSHGSAAADQAGGKNFLVAYDTNKNSLLATGIPMQWLTSIIAEQVRSDRIVLILDVCHSGAVGDGQKGLARAAGLDPRVMKIGRGQMVLCSSLADQVSWESKNYENSVFTRRLMEALQSNGADTSVLDAYKRLKIAVESEVLRDRGNLQTPLLINQQWLGRDPVLAIEAGE
jgi:tetratricopeptide (TPR) repeat protein